MGRERERERLFLFITNRETPSAMESIERAFSASEKGSLSSQSKEYRDVPCLEGNRETLFPIERRETLLSSRGQYRDRERERERERLLLFKEKRKTPSSTDGIYRDSSPLEKR